jgi:hypothetical protein
VPTDAFIVLFSAHITVALAGASAKNLCVHSNFPATPEICPAGKAGKEVAWSAGLLSLECKASQENGEMKKRSDQGGDVSPILD